MAGGGGRSIVNRLSNLNRPTMIGEEIGNSSTGLIPRKNSFQGLNSLDIDAHVREGSARQGMKKSSNPFGFICGAKSTIFE